LVDKLQNFQITMPITFQLLNYSITDEVKMQFIAMLIS